MRACGRTAGRALRLLWWVSPGLLVAALILGSARPARAQTPPEPSASTTTTVARSGSPNPFNDPLDPDDVDDEAPFLTERQQEFQDGGAVDNPCQPTDGGAGGTNGASILPDDCWGRYPSSNYDIGCDEGAWNHIGRKLYCGLTDLAFQGARSATATALWMLNWAYGFGVYERLGGPAIAVADTYERNFIGPLNLSQLAWFYAVTWAGVTGLRGRAAMAAGELALSMVLAGLAGLLLANPAGYLQGAFDTMGTVSGALLSTGTSQPPPQNASDADAVLQPLEEQLHKAFVEDPYDHLNWGGPIPPQCQAMRDRIVAAGPWGNSDDPREAMEQAGCEEQADFNHDPSGQRLFGAVLTLTSALVMVVLVALVSFTIVVSQAVAVMLFAVAPFAALGAILTGGGRAIAQQWVAAILRVAIVVIGMSFVLSLLLLTIQALLTAGDAQLIERFALVNIAVLVMFAMRRRVLGAGATLAQMAAGRLNTRSGAGDWAAAAVTGGVTGFAFGSSEGRARAVLTGRAAGEASRARTFRATLRAEERGRLPRATETVTIPVGADAAGRSRTVTISGRQPASRRARAARARVERQAMRGATRAEGGSLSSRVTGAFRRGGGGSGGDGGGGS